MVIVATVESFFEVLGFCPPIIRGGFSQLDAACAGRCDCKCEKDLNSLEKSVTALG
jgi:hypothetical protein